MQRIVETERLRALGEMAGGVAHDFNNTLAVILGRSQLLRKTTQDPNILRQYDVIEQAARDGARTVQRIQEFMRQDRPSHPVDLNQIVEGVVEATRSRWQDEAGARGVRYDVRTELTSVPTVLGDPAELREALTNLVFNALDAMPRGGTLGISTAVDGGAVICALRDTGIGMPEEVRRRVFDPFFTTKGDKGTGLGLSVTAGIIDRHGGEIDVASEPGRGSTFTIRLPVAATAAPAPVRAVPRPHRPGRILVIDDEAPVREVLVDLLVAQGHQAEAAADGVTVFQRLREVGARFDVVLTDLSMPGLSGWEVARLVARACPGTPVVLVSGYADGLTPEELRARGINFLVAKPFDQEDIQAAVARALAQKDFPASH
jgi:CheY-like chemotaxis protein